MPKLCSDIFRNMSLFTLAGKKGKKKKGKTLNLNEFLSAGDSKQAATFAKKKAVDIEEHEQSTGKTENI